MARKEIDITISDEGRDKDKVFHLREMPALKAEKWATRALSAIARSGVDIGHIPTGGMQALAIVGLQAVVTMKFEDAEPLLDEMLECIKAKPSPNIVRDLVEDDIEEVKTLFTLRKEVLDLHMGFSTAGVLSKQTSEPSASSSSTMQMSPEASVQFSQSPKTKPRR